MDASLRSLILDTVVDIAGCDLTQPEGIECHQQARNDVLALLGQVELDTDGERAGRCFDLLAASWRQLCEFLPMPLVPLVAVNKTTERAEHWLVELLACEAVAYG